MRQTQISCLLFLLACSLECAAQILPPEQSKIQNPKSKIAAPIGGKKMVVLDDRPTPLFWAEGVTQIGQLDSYRETGFNTVVVRLTWPPSPDGSLTPGDLAPQQNFARAAAARGLYVIYQLPAAPFGMERQLRMTADSQAYLTIWAMWVQAAIGELSETPNLIGWMLPDDPRALPYYEDLGFGRWLAANFANVGVVNRQWSTFFEAFEHISIADAEREVNQWRGPASTMGSMSTDELRKRMESANRRPGSENWTFHPAALSVASYKWSAYRALLARWARVIKTAAPESIVFSGRLPDYAQVLSAPPNVDIIVPDIRPDNAEMDLATHNPQAVDIARRGGRFGAIPVLTSAGAIPPETLPNLISQWADSALAHGASGLALSSWPALAANEPVRQAVESTLQAMQQAPREALWPQAPVATVAVVLTPLADGYTQPGALPGQGRGLYGFGENMIAGEPNHLVYALRWGTLFGSVDYLSPDDVESGAVNLGRYSTILLPQALSVSAPMEAALGKYVHGGGVLVADLGLGAMQAESQAASVPASLANLFGIVPQMRLRSLGFNLELLTPHALFPSWSRGTSMEGVQGGGVRRGAALTGGAAGRGVAFAGPIGFPVAVQNTLPETVAVALASQVPLQFGAGATAVRWERSTLTVSQQGRGFTVFAPFHLWTLWQPGHPGFDAFHGDLMARGAALAQGSSSLVPTPPNAQTMLYPETINLPNGVLLLNHLASLEPPPAAPQTQTNSIVVPSLSPNPASPPGGAATSTQDGIPTMPRPMANSLYSMVQTMGVGQFLWRGGICVFPPQGQSLPLSGRRAAPIKAPGPVESRPHSVSLYALVKPQNITSFSILPARAENLAGGPLSVHVADSTPTAFKAFLWPNSTAVVPAGSELGMLVTNPDAVRLTLYNNDNGHYTVRPLSRHRVQFIDRAEGVTTPATAVVQADAEGRLAIEMTGAAIYIEISPL